MFKEKLNIRQKKELNKELKHNHKWLFRTLDIMLIVMVTCNILAVLLTNMMVVKQTEDIEFKEANPAASKTKGYEQAEDWWPKISAFLIHTGLITLLVGAYLWNRATMTRLWELKLITYLYTLVGVIFVFDFVNNLGYWMGGLL